MSRKLPYLVAKIAEYGTPTSHIWIKLLTYESAMTVAKEHAEVGEGVVGVWYKNEHGAYDLLAMAYEGAEYRLWKEA